MATTANSSSWVRTYTKDDATKYQVAYRSNNVWKEDANGRALPGSFTTNLQVDRTAIDGNVTGGGVNATWTTAATRGPGASGVWERKYLDDSDTTLGEVPSRNITAILDVGSMEIGVSTDENADPAKVQSQSMMRYNTIFTQQLEATIPLNTNLCSGSLIKIKFAKVTTDKNKIIDDEQSGLYMIKELVHYYESRGSFTKLKLIRDTMGKKDK